MEHLEELEEDADAEHAEMEMEEEIEDYWVKRVNPNWTNSNSRLIREKNRPRRSKDQNKKKIMHHIFGQQTITTKQNQTVHLFEEVDKLTS